MCVITQARRLGVGDGRGLGGLQLGVWGCSGVHVAWGESTERGEWGLSGLALREGGKGVEERRLGSQTGLPSNQSLWNSVQNWAVKRQWRAHLHVKCHRDAAWRVHLPPLHPVTCVCAYVCLERQGGREGRGEGEREGWVWEGLRGVPLTANLRVLCDNQKIHPFYPQNIFPRLLSPCEISSTMDELTSHIQSANEVWRSEPTRWMNSNNFTMTRTHTHAPFHRAFPPTPPQTPPPLSDA